MTMMMMCPVWRRSNDGSEFKFQTERNEINSKTRHGDPLLSNKDLYVMSLCVNSCLRGGCAFKSIMDCDLPRWDSDKQQRLSDVVLFCIVCPGIFFVLIKLYQHGC